MVNIVITHKFQIIHVNFSIPNNKGRRLFESGHVTHVQELKLANGFSIISWQVIRQTSVTLTPWKVYNTDWGCPARVGGYVNICVLYTII